MSTRKLVRLFSDGCCLGNPGPGGYGAILEHGEHRRELSGGWRLTTNNRMELLAIIRGLEALKGPCAVEVFSDSRYIVDAMERGWVAEWMRRGWRRKEGGAVRNVDLWLRLRELCEPHDVKFHWVRGHSGHPENERCDALARAAAKQPGLPADEVYEAEQRR